MLGEFTAELCDRALDRADSAARLSELGLSYQFISRSERGDWFRVHSLFADYAQARLAPIDPDAPRAIHRRAAEWLRAHGLAVQAVEHAAAAGDDELLAALLVEYHLHLIRGGAGRTLLRWVGTLPDERIVEHPELAVGAATAAMLLGGRTLTQRRLLTLAERAGGERPDQRDAYVEAAARLVWAVTINRGVRQAVLDGRRAVALAEADANEILTAALSSYARALFFAGELDEASAVAMRALAHPAIERAVPSLVVARSTLALVAIDRGRLASARDHAEKAKAAVGRIGTSRSWLGATRPSPSAPCWPRRETWSRPSTSSPPLSAFFVMRWRACTTRGCSSCWPASVCGAVVSPRPRRRCAPRRGRSASSTTAVRFPRSPTR